MVRRALAGVVVSLALLAPAAVARADVAALRDQRRGRLPQRAAARRGRHRQRASSSRTFQATGSVPAHWNDQQPLYDGPALRVADAHATPTSPTTSRTRRSASRPATSSRPRRRGPGVTIVRDKRLRRPAHLRRHARRRRVRRRLRGRRRTACSSWTSCATPGGRELSSFVGGSAGNRAMDRTQWQLAPYTEADLQQPDRPRADGLRRPGPAARRATSTRSSTASTPTSTRR